MSDQNDNNSTPVANPADTTPSARTGVAGAVEDNQRRESARGADSDQRVELRSVGTASESPTSDAAYRSFRPCRSDGKGFHFRFQRPGNYLMVAKSSGRQLGALVALGVLEACQGADSPDVLSAASPAPDGSDQTVFSTFLKLAEVLEETRGMSTFLAGLWAPLVHQGHLTLPLADDSVSVEARMMAAADAMFKNMDEDLRPSDGALRFAVRVGVSLVCLLGNAKAPAPGIDTPSASAGDLYPDPATLAVHMVAGALWDALPQDSDISEFLSKHVAEDVERAALNQGRATISLLQRLHPLFLDYVLDKFAEIRDGLRDACQYLDVSMLLTVSKVAGLNMTHFSPFMFSVNIRAWTATFYERPQRYTDVERWAKGVLSLAKRERLARVKPPEMAKWITALGQIRLVKTPKELMGVDVRRVSRPDNRYKHVVTIVSYPSPAAPRLAAVRVSAAGYTPAGSAGVGRFNKRDAAGNEANSFRETVESIRNGQHNRRDPRIMPGSYPDALASQSQRPGLVTVRRAAENDAHLASLQEVVNSSAEYIKWFKSTRALEMLSALPAAWRVVWAVSSFDACVMLCALCQFQSPLLLDLTLEDANGQLSLTRMYEADDDAVVRLPGPRFFVPIPEASKDTYRRLTTVYESKAVISATSRDNIMLAFMLIDTASSELGGARVAGTPYCSGFFIDGLAYGTDWLGELDDLARSKWPIKSLLVHPEFIGPMLSKKQELEGDAHGVVPTNPTGEDEDDVYTTTSSHVKVHLEHVYRAITGSARVCGLESLRAYMETMGGIELISTIYALISAQTSSPVHDTPSSLYLYRKGAFEQQAWDDVAAEGKRASAMTGELRDELREQIVLSTAATTIGRVLMDHVRWETPVDFSFERTEDYVAAALTVVSGFRAAIQLVFGPAAIAFEPLLAWLANDDDELRKIAGRIARDASKATALRTIIPAEV